MLLINNIATGDAYAPALTLEQQSADLATFVVANAAAIAQLRPRAARGEAQPAWSEEILITPQAGSIRNVAGIRFRSAIAGTPARVIAILTGPVDPQLQGGVPFSQVLSAGGGITPGASSVQVAKDGVIIGTEPILNFLSTLGVFTIADNPGAQRVDITAPFGLSRIQEVSLGAPAGGITFGAIPQTHRHLLIVGRLRATGPSTLYDLVCRLNGDTGANYWNMSLYGLGGTNFAESLAQSLATCGWAVGAGSTLGGYSALALLFPNYIAASGHQCIGLSYAAWANAVSSQAGGFRCFVYDKAGVAAMTDITFSPSAGSFEAGSVLTLYGLE